MSMSEIHTLCSGLSSSKIFERKKSCDDLYQVLKSKEMVKLLDGTDDGDGWNDLFKCVRSAVYREIEVLGDETNRKFKPSKHSIMQAERCSDLLVLVIKQANVRNGVIDFKAFVQHFNKCLISSIMKEYCLSMCLRALREYIIPRESYWGYVSKEEWADLLEKLKILYHDKADLMILKSIISMITLGAIHRVPLELIQKEAEFVAEVCSSVDKTSQRSHQETVLKFFIDFCELNLNDSRTLCCSLGENILNNFIQLYDPCIKHTNIPYLIFESISLQMKIHHPNGSIENEKLAYAHSWEDWNQILRHSYFTVTKIMENEEGILKDDSTMEKKLHPVFKESVVEIYHQVCDPARSKPISLSSASVDVEPSSKRVRYESALTTAIDDIITSRHWAWIHLITEVLKKYPRIVSYNDYERLLEFLANYNTECKSPDTRAHTLKCLTVLIDVEIAQAELFAQHSGKLENTWLLIWETILRSVGLNQHQLEIHTLLQNYLLKKNPQYSIGLINIYLSRVIALSVHSIQSLDLIGQKFGISDSLPNYTENPKQILIQYILRSERKNHYSEVITAKVLTHLTLKQWPSDSPSDEARDTWSFEDIYRMNIIDKDISTVDQTSEVPPLKQYILNVDMLAVLLDILEEITLEVVMKKKGDIVEIIDTIIMFANLKVQMDHYKINDGGRSVINLLLRMLSLLWETLVKIFDKIRNKVYKHESYILSSVSRLLEVDRLLNDVVKDSVSLEFVVACFNILSDENKSNDQEDTRKCDIKISVVKLLSQVSMDCRNDVQKKAFIALISYQVDPKETVDYKLAITILQSLKARKILLDADQLEKILSMLQLICVDRYTQHNVAFDIITSLRFLYKHIAKCNDNERRIQYLRILKPFYEARANYGPKVSVAIAKCMGAISEVDAEYTWSKWPNEEQYIILDLPQFLKFSCMEVRMSCIDNLVIPFLQKHITNSGVYSNQKKLFKAVSDACRELFEGDRSSTNPDEFTNHMSTVFYALGMIIVNNSLLRQQALFELLNLTHINKLDKEKLKLILKKISKQLSLSNEVVLLELYLSYLLLQWNTHKYSLQAFPFELFNCDNESEFYHKYMTHIIPILINEEDTSVFEAVCHAIGKSVTDVIQVSYPKIIAKNLVLKSVKEATDEYKVSPEDISFSDNIQKRIKTYLPDAISAQITNDQAHEIVVNIIQFVFDLKHFQKSFDIEYTIPEPDTSFLSVDIFMDALELLKEKVCNVSGITIIEHFILKEPKKMQQLLLKLKNNIYKATTIEDKLLAFHRYAILLEVIAPHFKQDIQLKPFLIRDITYTLINISKCNFEILSSLAIKSLNAFFDAVLPHCSDVFIDFLVIIVSTLVAMVNTNTKMAALAQDALKKLIIDNQGCLKEGLKILDPFPDNGKFVELRQVHLRIKYGKVRSSLRSEIECFLKVGEYIKRDGCRIEGLIHLKEQLISKKEELKSLYADLYLMKGCLADGSCLHKLICALVQLTTSRNIGESSEATRCLGVLGSSDLTTLVLKNEEKLEKYKIPPAILSARQIICLLMEYIVDEDIQVALSASNALHAVMASNEGKQVIIKNHDLNVFNRHHLLPFISKSKSKVGTHVQIVENKFTDVINDGQLWCPGLPLWHNVWIVKLVTSILCTFSDGSFYGTLIDIVKLKIDFAEKLLPLLINVILDGYVKFFNPASEAIATFFERHWEHYWAEMDDSCVIVSQKASVQCMLDIVNFIRLQRNVYTTHKNLQNPLLKLNYLHVALAAQFCSAYFSTILYAELWVRDKASASYEKSKNMTPFDIICATTEQSKQLQTILRKTYIAIGDQDAHHYEQLLDPLDMSAQTNMYRDLNRWDMMVLHCDNQASHGNIDPGHANALKNFALFDHAVNYKQFEGHQYECLWRLGKWDVSTQQQLESSSKSFDYYNYKALKAFHENDTFTFTEAIESARQTVVQTLRHASLECCQNLYTPLTQLQGLQGLEDVKVAIGENRLQELVANWKLSDSINRNSFRYFEPVLSERISVLKILVGNGNGEMKAPLIDEQLKLAELARLEGNLNIAKRAIFDLVYVDNLDDQTKAKVMLEDAQIYWKIDKTAGIRVMKHLLNTYKDTSKITSEALKLYGSWMMETKTESSQTIITHYFLESIHILNDHPETVREFENLHDTHDMLARYADQEYQQIHKYTNSAIFQGKIQNMERLEKSAEKMEAAPNAKSQEVKRSIVVCRKQSAIDRNEIKSTHAEKNAYLKLAIKYYLFNLQYSNKNDIRMFRIVSLWLENRSNSEISSAIAEVLPKIPSYKTILILPQLVPHLTINTDSDIFAKQISKVIERCAVEHPHHAIPIVLSIANSNKDDKYSDTSASTEVNEPRVIGAQRLVQKLKKMPHLKNIIGQMESICEALIELAYYNCREESNEKKPIAIPRKYKILSINNYTEAIVATDTIPVNNLGKYENVVGIYKYRQEFNLVGGLNAPKRIKCIGTDGVERSELVKGKDDLRQDAVMQQVFTIMNELLAADKTTSNLLIRTYKVLPLSKRSGVLKWVDNSMPLCEYLLGKKGVPGTPSEPGAHRIYNPTDLTSDRCRAEFKKLADYAYDKKLDKYLTICEKFKPVFHKFFETTFLQPTVWYEKRKAYMQSVATTSMCGYILGLGDRHLNNILIDKITAEVIHIDFGIAFEQGKVLPTPETVPFRLTRDIEAGMGISGAEGTFRRSCEKTMEVLRNNAITILTILEVLLYDPLYEWTITPSQAYSRQFDDEDASSNGHLVFINDDNIQLNVRAERALGRLKEKLQGTEDGGYTSVEGHVNGLIAQARDPANLCKLFHGWQPYV